MDFKERFKGRTTTMKKEGFIETFETPANPVMKSQVNFQLQSASKIPSAAATGFSNNTVSQYRQFNPNPIENKELPYPPQSYSKGFAGPPHINPANSTQQNMMLTNNLAAKNPYLVSNPFPSLDMPNYQGNNGNNVFRESRQAQKPAFQPSVQQSLQGTGFNPESFYNQHSQFKNNVNGPMVHQSSEAQAHNPMFSTNLLAKKNFENLTQQNKQKRLAEEALRGFENQNPRFQTPNTRYEGQNNAAMSNYNNFYDKPPMYNGNRDSYSNPPPHQHLEENAFGYVPGNIHYQPAGQNQSGHNSFYSRASPEGMKTGFSNSSYKPYSLKDYKVIKEKDGVQLGGLGSNTGTDEWQKVKEKRDKMLEFSQNVKVFNANAQRTSGSEYNFKPRREKEKSPSKRDVALEFAKNVPKPKQQRREASPEQKSPELKARKIQSDIVSYKRAESDVTYRPAMMHNDVHNELAEYEQRHNHYRAQLEKLKLA